MLLKNFCMAISVPIAGSSSEDIYKVIRQVDGSYTPLKGTPVSVRPISGDFYNESGSYDTVRCYYEGIILGTGTTPPHTRIIKWKTIKQD